MHHIDIVLTHTYTIPGTFLRLFSNYKYNHISLVVDDKFDTLYSFARKKANSPLYSGFVKEHPSYFSLGKNKDITVKIHRLEITNDNYNKLINYLNELDNNEYIYNLFSLMLTPFNLNHETYKAYFCSEFVAIILDKFTDIKLKKQTCKYLPKDIDILLEKYFWYEGPFSKYTSVTKDNKDPYYIKLPLFIRIYKSLEMMSKLIIRRSKY